MSKNILPFKEKDPTKSREIVRRNELTPIITQIVENVNQMANHLLNDVNTLFKRFVYPNMMRLNAIENVLIAKGLLTKEEINEESKRITDEAVAKAKEIQTEDPNKKEEEPQEETNIEEPKENLENIEVVEEIIK
jgi:TPP-dependent pyruvate/acetoin dehydrogenase alpha subunit